MSEKPNEFASSLCVNSGCQVVEGRIAELEKDRRRLEWMAASGAEIFEDWGEDLEPYEDYSERWRVTWEKPVSGRWVCGEVWANDWRDAIDKAIGES